MTSTTIYIDVSELLARKLYTGIQRVVRQIARTSIETAPEFDVSVVPVVTLGSNSYALNATGKSALLDPPTRSYSLPSPTEHFLKKHVRSVLTKIPPIYSQIQRAFIRRMLAGLYAPQPIRFDPNTCYVLLDSFWGGGSSAYTTSLHAKKAGSKVVPVIYDLIPITHPEFVDAQNVLAFRREVPRVLSTATGVITISKYCVEMIEIFTASIGCDIPVAHFYLGADFQNTPDDVPVERAHWPVELHGGKIYTMVGTIEPRKGHSIVLDGFDELWREGRDDRLLIIGRVGWAVDSFMTRCAEHPELGKRLFMIHNATDAMLAEAYSFSNAAVIASTVEGFGLPLVEAMNKGLPVIASDIPVFREIGSDAVLFFSLDDPVAFARAVVEMDSDYARYQSAAREFRWINWTMSGRQFLTSVLFVSGQSKTALAS